MSHADEVREYCNEHYILPARKRGEMFVSMRSGDIHKDLHYSNKLPLVCSAIGSNVFEETFDVKRIKVEGPLNGSNTVFTFQING